MKPIPCGKFGGGAQTAAVFFFSGSSVDALSLHPLAYPQGNQFPQ
jgi:hypothetical protein